MSSYVGVFNLVCFLHQCTFIWTDGIYSGTKHLRTEYCGCILFVSAPLCVYEFACLLLGSYHAFRYLPKLPLIGLMGVALFLRRIPAKENIVLYYSSVCSSWRHLVVLH